MAQCSRIHLLWNCHSWCRWVFTQALLCCIHYIQFVLLVNNFLLFRFCEVVQNCVHKVILHLNSPRLIEIFPMVGLISDRDFARKLKMAGEQTPGRTSLCSFFAFPFSLFFRRSQILNQALGSAPSQIRNHFILIGVELSSTLLMESIKNRWHKRGRLSIVAGW